MNLLLDYGNSRLKWCLLDGKGGQRLGACQRDAALVAAHQLGQMPIARALLASVASPSANRELLDALATYNIDAEIVRSKAQYANLQCGYENPAQMGVDRWLAVLGAHLHAPHSNFIIVSAGTACTIDALQAGGLHLGGYIVPGLSLMRESLAHAGALLPKLDSAHDAAIRTDFGRSTATGIGNGTLMALIQLLIYSAQDLQRRSRQQVKIVITGGNAAQLFAALPAVWQEQSRVVDDLVFKALSHICNEQNAVE